MKRRNFLQTGSAITLPLLLNGFQVGAIPKSSIFNAVNNGSDKVIVLIQLGGGNDGLNTVLPIDQYSNLASVRSNLLIPESVAIPLTDTAALHPSMTGFKNLYEDASLTIIQSVGYPNQNRSHFRSTDIWTSGSAADVNETSGWMGRFFDLEHPSYPEDFPNNSCPDPIALTIGSIVSETCQGNTSNFSLAITNPDSVGSLVVSEEGDVPNTPYGQELTFIRDAVVQTNAYASTIMEASDAANNLSSLYPADNRLADQLKVVARLIAGGLQTKVYVVSLGGFDTHASQVVAGDPTQGEHANLLQLLSSAVEAFQDDLKLLNIQDRVVGMTFSEFGRRIRSNFSLGTDHGTAAPMFVFGACVNSKIIGDNPEISVNVDVQDGVPMQYDFRSVYGSILMDWFEVAEGTVKNLLDENFQYIPIIEGCQTVPTKDFSFDTEINAYNFPNPFSKTTTISFNSKDEWLRVSVFDMFGNEIKVLASGKFRAGTHQLEFDASGLPAGNYAYRIQFKNRQKTKLMLFKG